MADLKIASMNVRGIGNNNKRRETFNWLRNKQQSIIFLQEVHCTEATIDMWRSEWGYKALFSCLSSNSAGVCILFNNNFKFDILKTFLDPSGRYIVCDIKTDEKLFTLANIYAPNEDDPTFFKQVFDRLHDFACEEIIVGGDFNLVLDVKEDKKGGLPRTHQNALKIINQTCEELNLTDVWRTLNAGKHRYTWRRKKPEIQCRLDFFLISSDLICDTNLADIVPGYKTDHSMILLKIALHYNPRGRGFWKLNTSLLKEKEYLNLIKTTIDQTKSEYQSDNSVNPALLWDMIKMKVREKSISYATAKNHKTKSREDILFKEISRLEKELDGNTGLSDTQKSLLQSSLDNLKSEMEEIIEYRTKGAVLRSRTRWYNEGEKNTKYFLNLEKRHYRKGTISRLKKGENDFATTDKEILHECESFFKDLYSSKMRTDLISPETDSFFSENDTVLSNEERDSIEGLLTELECLNALKDMESDKSPGTDGLPSEFYQMFWNDVSKPLLEALNYGFEIGKLSISQKRGIIKLIPKKSEELYYVKNWRPLTLLNCDYKIATKAIANRLKTHLHKLISNDQTGFLKGRFIGENIRLIDSVINYTAVKKIPGLLLFLDFEKAFDTLELPFIQKTLISFGFGPSIVQWFKTFYNYTESCIMNNGWASNFFSVHRGVRQGCPLSPYLFILSAEILAKAIRKNADIKGLMVKDTEIKLSQYADDTTLILDGSEKSLSEVLRVLESFEKVSGLRLNSKKTEALWIGSCAGKSEKLYSEKDFNWQNTKVKVLGVWLSTHQEITTKLNFSEKIEKMRNCLGSWSVRRLSLIGKITVLKSLIASQVIHLLSPLQVNSQIIKQMNDLFFEFLWNSKGDKIKRNVITQDYGNGGLRMIDIASFNKALKSVWIRKYLDESNKGKWKIFFDAELEKLGGQTVFRGNLDIKDSKKLAINLSPFLKEILEIWSELNFQGSIETVESFLTQSLWYNSLIRIMDKPVFYKSWYQMGISHVNQIVKEQPSTFLSQTEFESKYHTKVCPLTLYGMTSTLRELWKNKKPPSIPLNGKEQESFATAFLKSKKPSKLAYLKLVEAKCNHKISSQEKWAKVFPEARNLIWHDAYMTAIKCTKSTKLIEFQFRFLHQILATNVSLVKMGYKDDISCTFCHEEAENFTHLFWFCRKIEHFWKCLIASLKDRNCLSNDYLLNNLVVLSLKPDTSKNKAVINFVFLLARFYIWLCRSKGNIPTIENFKPFLQQYKKEIEPFFL